MLQLPATLKASDLAQAYLHGLLVERALVADTPAEVDGLESSANLFAQLVQLRKYLALKNISLLL